jgi:hypothetical protein
MKREIRKLCFVVLSTLFVFTACKKNENPVTETTPETGQGRIIDAVLSQNGSAVYIPLNPGDSVRRDPQEKLGKSRSNPGVQLNCQLYFNVTKVGWSYTVSANACFIPPSISTIQWFLFEDGVEIGFMGATLSSEESITTTNVPIVCGRSYNVEARYLYRDAGGVVRTGITKGVQYWTAGILQTVGLGAVGDGADVKITEINGNGIPDLLFMAYDDAPGANYFKYYFLFDVNPNGTSSTPPVTQSVIGMGNEGAGAGAVIEDINGNGIKDLIVMAYDDPPGANTFRYRVGFDLSATGVPTSWSVNYIISGLGDLANGAGIALWDIDKNGVKDIILMAYVDPTGANIFRYKIGLNPDSQGAVTAGNWRPTSPTTYVDVPGVGDKAHGAGFDIRDVDNNGFPEFFFMAYDDAGAGENSFRYRIVHNVNTAGIGTNGANYFTYRGVGGDGQGAGLALGDITGDGNTDILLMAYDNTPGNAGNTFRTRIGYNLPASGNLVQPSSFWCGF